jgi:transposase-like protein
MRKAVIKDGQEQRMCPKCHSKDEQVNNGISSVGAQKCYCKKCKRNYTFNGKMIRYSNEAKTLAIRMYNDGDSGRKVGLQLGIGKNAAIRWTKELAKKNEFIVDKCTD